MNYLKDIYILSHIKRYSTVYTLRQESVAEHSFFVAAILFELREKYDFNLPMAVCMAITHDIPEMELNDVPRLIKRKYPKIEEAFDECEQEVLKSLPDFVRLYFQQFSEDDCIEAKMVRFADIIQCEQYAQVEVDLGNVGYMNEVLLVSQERIHDYEQELIEYER